MVENTKEPTIITLPTAKGTRLTLRRDLGSSLNLQHFAKSIRKPPTQPAIPSGSPTTPSAISSPKPTVRKGSGRTGGNDLLLRPPGSSAALIAGHGANARFRVPLPACERLRQSRQPIRPYRGQTIVWTHQLR